MQQIVVSPFRIEQKNTVNHKVIHGRGMKLRQSTGGSKQGLAGHDNGCWSRERAREGRKVEGLWHTGFSSSSEDWSEGVGAAGLYFWGVLTEKWGEPWGPRADALAKE